MINISIDVGTTNTKVTLWNEFEKLDRKIFETPKKNNGADFNLKLLWDRVSEAIGNLSQKCDGNISKIGIASVAESGILLDEREGKFVGPCIVWYDKRSQNIINNLSIENKDEIYSISGIPVHPHYSSSKIKWILNHYPNLQEKELVWLCIPDYIVYKLTGEIGTDQTLASRTGCYDINKKEWSKTIKSIYGIENISFPNVYPSGTTIGKVTKTNQELLNLLNSCEVVIAGHDHMVGSRAVGLTSDELLDSTGTTEAMMLLSNEPILNDSIKESSITEGWYVDNEQCAIFTALPSAGSVISWINETLSLSSEDFNEIILELYDNYIDDNLRYNNEFIIPHFNGSGSPNKRSYSKGIVYGLDLNIDKKSLVFAMFVGLTFEFVNAYKNLPDSEKITKIKVIGPAIRDDIWLQLKADLLGLEVVALDAEEIVSLGVETTMLSKVDNNLKTKKYEPQENEIVRKLRDSYAIYTKIYDFKMRNNL